MKNRKENMPCYLRTHRRMWGLTQKELAKLLGGSTSQISRLEQSKRGPSIRAALACQVLFGLAPSDMFPSLHEEVEDRVIRAAYLMHQGLDSITKISALRKRELLELAMNRAVGKGNASIEV